MLKTLPGAKVMRDALYQRPGGESRPKGALRPIVYLPTWLEWDVMRQRPQYILEALARAGHPVWFVDPRAGGRVETSSGVTIVSSLRPVPRSDVIVYTHFAPASSLIDRFENPVVVYDILDDLSIYDPDEIHLPTDRTVRHHHPALASRADVVTVSNQVLYEKHVEERPDLVLMENGVDLRVFTAEGAVTDGLPPGPIVGYHGAVSLWFDFDLVESLAKARSDLSIVLVGPVDDRVTEQTGRLRLLPNVHMFPAQTVDGVVTFVRGFDVGIIPFVIDEMTRGVTPLKMYEYLALGIPCVATPLPSCLAHQAIAIAGDSEELSASIDVALDMDDSKRQRLRSWAEQASWDRRVEVLLERLESIGSRTVPTR